MRNIVDCPDVIIGNGQTNSNAVLAPVIHGDAEDVILMCTGIDGTKTYTIQINDKADGTGNWYTWNDGTSDILPPIVANKASSYPFLNHTFRIVASGAVVGPLTWKMKLVEALSGFMR